jgi:flagellar basal body rod protein FlgG
LEYDLRLSNRLQLAIKADTNYFHVGKIGGELYIAEYSAFWIDENGQYVLDENGYPIIETTPAHTEKITESLTEAVWRSFGLHIGFKYSF